MSAKDQKHVITNESKGNSLLSNVTTPPADVNRASLEIQKSQAAKTEKPAKAEKPAKTEKPEFHKSFEYVGLRVYDVDSVKFIGRLTKAEDLMTIMNKQVFAEMIPSPERGVTFRYDNEKLQAWVDSIPRKVKAQSAKTALQYKMFSVDTYDGMTRYVFAESIYHNLNIHAEISGIRVHSTIAENVFADCAYDDIAKGGTIRVYRDGKKSEEISVNVQEQRFVRPEMFNDKGEYLKDGQPAYQGEGSTVKDIKQATRLMYSVTLTISGKDGQAETVKLSEMGLTNVLRAMMRRYSRIIVS